MMSDLLFKIVQQKQQQKTKAERKKKRMKKTWPNVGNLGFRGLSHGSSFYCSLLLHVCNVNDKKGGAACHMGVTGEQSRQKEHTVLRHKVGTRLEISRSHWRVQALRTELSLCCGNNALAAACRGKTESGQAVSCVCRTPGVRCGQLSLATLVLIERRVRFEI